LNYRVGFSSLQIISVKKVDFWTISSEDLPLLEEEYLYPPRFIVGVKQGVTATSCIVNFYFKGAAELIQRGMVLTDG